MLRANLVEEKTLSPIIGCVPVFQGGSTRPNHIPKFVYSTNGPGGFPRYGPITVLVVLDDMLITSLYTNGFGGRLAHTKVLSLAAVCSHQDTVAHD